jgi:hypothetical protein
MKMNVLAGVVASALLTMSVSCLAADWVKNEVDIPNKNVEANFYDGQSVKSSGKTMSWTEKYLLTQFGATHYSRHLQQFPACKKNMAAKGEVTQHQMDFEIKQGKFRVVAKRNYNKDGELVCTDKEMGNELDSSWRDIVYKSPMYERYYILVTKYQLGNI